MPAVQVTDKTRLRNLRSGLSLVGVALPEARSLRTRIFYAAGGDESVVRRLPRAIDGISCPAWSADFEKVADLRSGLVMRADGTRREQFDFPFTWSSDAHDFAYSDVDSEKIMVVIGDNSKPRPVAMGFLPTWAPNGLIYYDHDTNLDSPTKGVEVDTGNVQTSPGDGWFIHGRWSPDGQRVSYIRSFSEDGIFLSETGTFDEPEMLLDAHVTAHGWSPDGERLAVVAETPGHTVFSDRS